MPWYLGLMSGTSMDGIDAALIDTDGDRVRHVGAELTDPYDAGFRESVRAVLGRGERDAETDAVERDLTLRHAAAVRRLLAQAGRAASDIAAVGFHGQTIIHAPDRGLTRQLGDGALLAQETGIATVFDFRSADVAAGGEGAPLAPAFHQALAAGLEKPLAVLNIGGVANLTYLAEGADPIAFDTGPGNAPLDDWVARHGRGAFDRDGAISGAGSVDRAVLDQLLDDPYFTRPWPKSLDRNGFDLSPVAELPVEDGAATLAAFAVEAIAKGAALLPNPPKRWLVCGGGRHNPTLMRMLETVLEVPVAPVETIGWDGDAIEAQAFAFLAARVLAGKPITFPGTTGVAHPMTGGRIAQPTS